MKSSSVVVLFAVVLALLAGMVGAAEVIGVDPNTPGAAASVIENKSDMRLAQKVTYEARHKLVSEVLDDLSAMTGVTLYAGYNNQDWQVRDRWMNIFAKDITLADLVSSIARVMKFKWSINQDKQPVTYRLHMDRRTLLEEEGRKYRDAEKRKKQIDERRKEAVESISRLAGATPEEIARMREADPCGYLLAATGIAGPFSQLMQACPQIKDALMSGEETTLGAGRLSPQAQQALLASMQAMWKMNEKVGIGASLYNSDGTRMAKPPIPIDIEQKLDKVRIEIKSNTDLSAADPFEAAGWADISICFDNNYIKDGHTYGLNDDVSICLMDPTNPLAKTVASLCGKMIDGDSHAMDGGFSVPMSPDQMNPPDFGEALVKHPEDEPDPALAVELELKKDEKPDQEENLADAVKARRAFEDMLARIAESTGLAVVSDSYGNLTQFSFGNDKLSAEKILEFLCMTGKLNWWKRDGVIELRDRLWFRKRSAQIPEKTLAGWRNRFVGTSYMELDDLTQVCALSKEQFEVNIRGDEVLDQFSVWNEWVGGNNVAALYRALDTDQQKVFRDGGLLELRCFSPAQWAVFEKLVNHANPAFFDQHDRKDCSLKCERQVIGASIRYLAQIVQTQDSKCIGLNAGLTLPRYEKAKKSEQPEVKSEDPGKQK